MKLFYTKGACSLAARIVIHELDLACDYVSVDLHAKKTESGQDYYEINPKGEVPTLQLDDGKILTENAVIQQYLADENKAYQLLPKAGDFERYRVLEWLNFISSDLHKGFGVFFSPQISQELKDNFFTPLIKRKLDYVNDALKDQEYLLGDHFTLPDGYMFVIINWAIHFKFDLSGLPNIERYYRELRARPSIKKSLEEERILVKD